MGRLHELLAVEGDLQGVAKKVIDETINTFTKKVEHFRGHVKTLSMFDETRNELEGGVVERKELVTTVCDKLKYMFDNVSPYYDAVLQKEQTNQKAKADLVVNGVTLGKDLPATFLLGLETKLKSIRSAIESIPTLQPGISWESDDVSGTGVYKTKHPVTTYKTEKTIQHKVMYEATKEHPAQLQAWNEDVKIGRYETDNVSGMLTVSEKSMRLKRIDELIRCVKKARQAANNVDIEKASIGKNISNYIMG